MTNSENSSRLYEVSMPHPTRDQQLALQGMASALGWAIEEISERPRQVVTEETFQETSATAWGDPTYGVVAYMLTTQEWQPRQQPTLHATRDHYEIMNSSNSSYIARRRDSAAVVENNLRRKWEDAASPYELLIEKPAHSSPDEWTLQRGDMTQERLARYAISRSWNAHNLRGTLGKALEVVSLTAGLLELDDIDPAIATYDDRPFITIEDFEKQLRTAPILSHRRKAIKDAIHDALRDQIAEPAESGRSELIAEGLLSRQHRTYRPDRLAVDSLSAIRDRVRFDDQKVFLDRLIEG